eukprot:7382850-Prymnesium_polylepis.1
MFLASGDAYVNRKAPKIPDGYVWKDYHDPWAKYREMQPRLKHPVAPSPAESHECEATMDMLQEGKPRIQFLMRQPGVREAVFAVRRAARRARRIGERPFVLGPPFVLGRAREMAPARSCA